MSKRCPHCGNINEDSRIFCSACGDPLDADLRLIMDVDKQKKQATNQPQRNAEPTESPRPRTASRYDDDEEVASVRREEKKSPLPWILLGLAAVAAAVLFFVL